MAVNNCINNEADSLTALTNGLTVALGATTLTPIAATGTGIAKISSTGVLSNLEDTDTNGQLLIGVAAGAPVWASPTSSGGTITLTLGAGTLNLEVASPAGLTWSELVADKTPMVVNEAYIANKAGTATACTLPAASLVGAEIKIVGKGATGWSIVQGVGQYVILGTTTSTVGAGGSLASTEATDSISMVCTEADLGWTIYSAVGNITVS